MKQRSTPSFRRRKTNDILFKKISLQSPAEIHLKSNFKDELNQNGHIRFVFILSSIGFLIALIAVINITNLTSARAAVRAKEVAVRKILGSSRTEIFFQILSESLILSTASVFLSLVFFEIFFRNLSRSLTNFLTVPSQEELILPVIISGFVFGLLSGVYPAVITAAFDPIDALRGKMIKTTGAHTIRKILIVVQTGITSMLLVVTTVNYTQVMFLRSKKLGFDKNDVYVVPIQHTQFFLAYDSFKHDLLSQKLALHITAADAVVGKEHFVRPYKAGKDEKTMLFNEISVKPDFLETFRLQLIAGRNFYSDSLFLTDTLYWRKKLHHDDTTAVIVNREMTKFIGFERPEEALGYPLHSLSGNEVIVGVVENFHYKSLQEHIQPLILDLPHGIRDNYLASRYLLLKMADNRSQSFLATEKLWKKYLPAVPFEYFSLRSKLDELYLQEERLAKIASLFTELAILISCLGLFGMSSFLAALKRHEVGIRKALGAGFWEIYAIFAQYFLPLLLIGIILGNILATIINFLWLNSFAFHVSFHFVPYFVSSLVVILIALLIISFHAVRSALSNPVDDLNNF